MPPEIATPTKQTDAVKTLASLICDVGGLVANIDVTIVTFRPIGSTNTISATFTQRPAPEGGQPTVQMDGSYYIKVKRRGHGTDPNDKKPHVKIRFWFETTDYLPLGIYFNPIAGDFPEASIESEGNYSTLTVTNLRQQRNRIYEYSILVQRRSDEAVGIIDPEIENEH